MEKPKHWMHYAAGLFTDDALCFALPRIAAGIVMGALLLFAPARPLRMLEIFAWLLLPAFFLPVHRINSWRFYAAAVLTLIFALILWRKLWAAPGAGAAVWMIFSAYSAGVHALREKHFGWKIMEFCVAALECAIAFFFVWRSLSSDQPDLPLLFGFGLIAAALFAATRLFRKF